MPAKLTIGAEGRENQCSTFASVSPDHSQKSVAGARQRLAGFFSIDRQKGLAKFLTLVTGLPLSGTPSA